MDLWRTWTLTSSRIIAALGYTPAATGAYFYRGTWDASTNSPALVSSTGTQGDIYRVSTTGTTTLDGVSAWTAGDHAAFNGTIWEKWEGVVTDADLSTSDITTNDVSTSKHGFAPKLPNDAAKFLNGVGGYTTPATVSPSIGSPQGRLTLTSATPVLTATVSAASTIYYALYSGNQVPIYDGVSAFVMTTFTELSNATAQSSTGKAGPAAVANNSNYDLFVWSNSGTPTLTRGPAWTSDTARGTGAGTTELQRVLGIWTNKVAITNGPGAGLGTYVGTVRSNGTATVDFIRGAIAANGTAAVLGVWNAYNRVGVRGLVGDSTDSWNYSTATIRPANNSSTMRVSFVSGLQEDFIEACYTSDAQNSNGGGVAGGVAGVGYDSTTAFSGQFARFTEPNASSTVVVMISGTRVVQDIGFHYLQALEKANDTTATQIWYGDNGGVEQTGLNYAWSC